MRIYGTDRIGAKAKKTSASELLQILQQVDEEDLSNSFSTQRRIVVALSEKVQQFFFLREREYVGAYKWGKGVEGERERES